MAKGEVSGDFYGLDTIECVEKICKAWGVNLEKGKGMKGAKINNGGWPIWNECSKHACEKFANMTKSTG